MKIPVIDKNQTPLMPTAPAKARHLVRVGKATPFWKRGIFCIRLNYDLTGPYLQDIAVGIDPGSKKEALTVKSSAHTFLNIQADAVTWVGRHVKQRRTMRLTRRNRNTPHRANRKNRSRGGIPPSTKARWQWKLRIVNWLCKIYPITQFVVEDIKAWTRGQRRWDASFSPLEIGKSWFYSQLGNLAPVETKQGWETKELRDGLGLKKSGDKSSDRFEAHCVDSWILANWWVGGHTSPDIMQILSITPLQFHRRQLHYLQPDKRGIRKPYGGTQSKGFKRGSWVKHPKWGICYVGGTTGDRISLHSLVDGKRLCQNARPSETKFLAYNTWRARLLPTASSGVSAS